MKHRMPKVLVTAYAVNPYKGSEDGTGWNMILEIARHNKVVAITRKNNRADIDRYLTENSLPWADNLSFAYFDWPYWLRFWKKGGRGALLYFYLWQIGLVFFIWRNKFRFDIAHHLNFHNDWTPSFLWLLNRPMVWGPIGHHPAIPKAYLLRSASKKAYLIDRLKWGCKQLFWYIDPFLKITTWRAKRIFTINSSVRKRLSFTYRKEIRLPAVATQAAPPSPNPAATRTFQILSIGRFVPLKGFDLTIAAFSAFYHQQKPSDQANIRLTLIGKGPQKDDLVQLAGQLGLSEAVQFVDWMSREELDDYFRSSSAFLFPSHEGAGMVVPEALSFGLPVLCFDNIGPGEFINKQCGFKVPYTQPEESIASFAKHLQVLFQQPAVQQRLAAGARRQFAQNFTWERKGQIFSKAYRDILFPQSSKSKEKIVCTHLYNDYSGSPLILSTAIKGFLTKGHPVDVITSTNTSGFLSQLNVRYRDNAYRFLNNRYLRLLCFLFSQLTLFIKAWSYRKEKTVFYINTLLPFGLALAGRLMGKKVIYHIHETSVRPAFLKRFLKWVAIQTAHEVIYVSHFLKQEEALPGVPGKVIYNALSKDFVMKSKASPQKCHKSDAFCILMLCSLKKYKGVNEFVALAKGLPNHNFELVLNAEESDIQSFFSGVDLPKNLQLFPRQRKVHAFYQRAHLVVNLSHPEEWVETFGMTLLEGMHYGLPAIAPPVGGPTEIVRNGFNGFQIDLRELDEIADRITQLALDKGLYQQLSSNAKRMAQQFRVDSMQKAILDTITTPSKNEKVFSN